MGAQMNAVPHGATFNSEDYATLDRSVAWRQVIGKLGFAVSENIEEDEFNCAATFMTSLVGMNFAKISCSAQTLTRNLPLRDEALFVFLHQDGHVACESDGRKWTPAVGDVLLVPATKRIEIASQAGFRGLMVSIPKVAFNSRLVQATLGDVCLVRGESGIGRVLSALLSSVAQTLGELQRSEIRPLDLLILEMLMVATNSDDMVQTAADAAGTQSMILRRICQNIELRLGDRNLDLKRVAKEEGISPRYLQKLFRRTGESFTHYLLCRRLERCSNYLTDPHFDNLSISEICFHWGFGDPAHFSRVFRDKFGKTPSDYRKDRTKRQPEQLARATRGWPSKKSDALRHQNLLDLPRIGSDMPCRVRKDSGPVSQSPADGIEDVANNFHHLKAAADTVHWGYFSRSLEPVLEIASGDFLTIETLTHHAYDDYERMIKGDPGVESVFEWTSDRKGVNRRGAGPMNASIYGRGAGEGFGTQIMTGPVAIRGAAVGDVIEVRILDIVPRPCANPDFMGRAFGSNAATWWGFHFKELLEEPAPRENVTIYEILNDATSPHARALYSYRWTEQSDPFGVKHSTIDYPGIPVDHSTIEKIDLSPRKIQIPLRPHFGVVGVAPRESVLVDSIPPSYFGGNIDNWRLGKGSKIYLSVSVPGALLSLGDPHAAQGDSELGGTAIECSMTGLVQVILHKKADLAGKPLHDLTYPLLETEDAWILTGFSHANYLAELGEQAQSKVYTKSSIDLAMKDAFRKTRRFLMANWSLSEDEAITIMSVAVDFGISQVVDGNWGVHAILPKSLFVGH